LGQKEIIYHTKIGKGLKKIFLLHSLNACKGAPAVRFFKGSVHYRSVAEGCWPGTWPFRIVHIL
jgi:hypothetical protein